MLNRIPLRKTLSFCSDWYTPSSFPKNIIRKRPSLPQSTTHLYRTESRKISFLLIATFSHIAQRTNMISGVFLLSLLISTWLGSSVAFVSQNFYCQRPQSVQSLQKVEKTKLNLFLAPQIGFAAACAGAVFAYVYSNIDSIKEVTENGWSKSFIFAAYNNRKDAISHSFSLTRFRRSTSTKP
jgi:hypothetical protein